MRKNLVDFKKIKWFEILNLKIKSMKNLNKKKIYEKVTRDNLDIHVVKFQLIKNLSKKKIMKN